MGESDRGEARRMASRCREAGRHEPSHPPELRSGEEEEGFRVKEGIRALKTARREFVMSC
uniref:Uncharacterized protein n=1 Tax=Oryza meridionalis TaxID=40149 RepID=A0A0E0DFQ5_9ORYZ